MEKRQNLVRELQNPEYRDKFLHPKKRSKFETFKKLFGPIFKESKIGISYIFYSISMGLIPIMGAFIVNGITEVVQNILTSKVNIDVDSLKPLILIVIGYTLLFILLTGISRYLETVVIPFFFDKRNMKLLNNFRKFSTMEFGLYEDSSFQNAIGFWAQALQGNNTGYQGILERSFQLTGDVLGIILLLILLGGVSFWIPVIGIISIVCYTYIEVKLEAFQRSKLEEDQKTERMLTALKRISADFKYGKDVRVYKMQGAITSLFDKLIAAKEKLLMTLFKYRMRFSLPSAIILSVPFLFGLYFLSDGYIAGRIDSPRFLMLITALILSTNLILKISQDVAFILGQSIYLDDLFDWLEVDLNPRGGKPLPDKMDYSIKFEDVWFRYPGSERWILEGVSLTIPQGSSLALVGVNGAGKTTLIKLLTGLYQVEKGAIYINGTNIDEINQSELAKIFGVVFQDVNPVALTVAENVAVEIENIDEKRVREVLEKVGLLEKIESFPLGIHTPLLKVIEDNGIILSGGENQKLMIARALYKDSGKILILDEPTAALDALAEEEIYKSFNELLKGKTAVFISHRLASTRFCDRIALLNKGVLEEEGTHEELLNNGGLYSQMYETQASYYKEDGNNEKW